MSEKRYMVPEGMLTAASVRADVTGLLAKDRLELILEAAIRWLAENPIVPTVEQRAELSCLVPYEDSGNGKILSVACVEWQRRMFLAPEPEVDENEVCEIGARLRDNGVKISNSQVGHVLREREKIGFQMVNEAVKHIYSQPAPKPEVPEAIKDLMHGVNGYPPLTHDELVLESFHRGQKSKENV